MREHGQGVVCHPPYQPQDGPVEYAINQVCGHLEKRWSEVKDLVTMKTRVAEITDRDIHSMDDTFLHCGYVWN